MYTVYQQLNTYFIENILHVTYYSNQLTFTPIPQSLTQGYATDTSIINGYTYSGFNSYLTTIHQKLL